MKLKKAFCIGLCALLLAALLGPAVFAQSGPDAAFASLRLTGSMEKTVYSADGAVEAMILNPSPDVDEHYRLPEGVAYDYEGNTLTLTDFRGEGCTLLAEGMGDDFQIRLVGASALAGIRSSSLGAGGSLSFCGDGALEISNLSDAAILIESNGTPDFLRFEPQVRVTAATYGGSAVCVRGTSLSGDVIRFDTASPDVRAFDSSAPVQNVMTADGALIDLVTLPGEGGVFGLEATIVTEEITVEEPAPIPETPQIEESGAESGEAAESGETAEGGEETVEQSTPEESVTPPAVIYRTTTVEKLAYNVYRIGMPLPDGSYEAVLEREGVEDVSAYAPYYSEHCFTLCTPDGSGAPRVRFGRFSLSAASDGNGSVSVSPAAVGRGGSAVVSYQPNEGYKLASLLINGVAVSGSEGSYTIASVTEDVLVEASFAEAAPASLLLTPPAVTDYPVPADNEAALVSEPFRAVVLDGAGDAVNLPVSWTLTEEVEGVSVSADGRVSVSNAAKSAVGDEGLSLTLTAAAEGTELTASADFTLHLEERRPCSVEILRGERPLGESDTLSIPVEGQTTTAAYSAAFTDQYGERLEADSVWSATQTPAGVSLDRNVLTVSESCVEDSDLMITAAAASTPQISASLNVRFTASALEIIWPTVSQAENPVYGITWGELLTLEGGSAQREGESVEGSFSLVTLSEIPNVSDSYCIRFTWTDADGETQTQDSESETVSLARKPLSADMITLSPASTPYTGSPVTPAVSLRHGGRAMAAGVDYSVGEFENNVDIGTGSVTVEGLGNYEGSAVKSFTITPIPAGAVKSIVVRCQPEDVGIAPAVALRHGETTLARGTDYDVSFRYDIPSRTGTATFTLKGIYSGTIISSFDLPNYLITEGANSIWNKSSSDSLRFKANGALEKFSDLTVDGRSVDSRYYTVESGSTIVRIKPDYLKSLSAVKHIIGVAYQDGKALAIFSVTETSRRGVATGDSNNVGVWIAVAAASAVTLCVLGYVLIRGGRKPARKKKRK